MKNFLCLVFCGIVVFSLSNCAFQKLGDEVAILDQTSLLQGTISSPSPHKKPFIVLLCQLLDNDKKLVAYSVHHTPGTFTFVRFPGRYLIAAFEGANEDLVYQAKEYAAYVGNGSISPSNREGIFYILI